MMRLSGSKDKIQLTIIGIFLFSLDIGAGDSDLTWQASVGIAYKLDWGDIIGTYRYIHYDKDDSLLVNDFDLYGPKIGVVFHF